MSMSYMLKCQQNRTDCFAINFEGKCGLLESVAVKKDGKDVRLHGTKFGDRPCPFYKTIAQAGGTYETLCYRYKVEDEK